uniref:Secreted protein n=1 Tax=Ixodes ricinus TaxID=34613 RepID=A0A6B0U373_IXORI
MDAHTVWLQWTMACSALWTSPIGSGQSSWLPTPKVPCCPCRPSSHWDAWLGRHMSGCWCSPRSLWREPASAWTAESGLRCGT